MSEKEAEKKLALNYGISRTEAKECFTLTKSVIDDENKYSELLVHFYWTDKREIVEGCYHEEWVTHMLNTPKRKASDRNRKWKLTEAQVKMVYFTMRIFAV